MGGASIWEADEGDTGKGAVRDVSERLRTPLLSNVLPLCRDLSENAARIRSELTHWELVCTERDFEQAAGGW